MISISLCMIVKDDEEILERCLDTAMDVVDEIIIVDTGSSDNTKKIAYKYTSKLYDFHWINDFAAARNYSFSKATKEYILWLDADDILLEEDRSKLKLLKEKIDSSIDILLMKYNLGADETGKPLGTSYRERLFKRSKNYQWQDPVYEYIKLEGKVMATEIAITHLKPKKMTPRNLDIIENVVKEGKELSSRMKFYYARELYIIRRYDEAKIYYEKFISQDDGSSQNYMEACIDLSKIHSLKNDKKSAVRALLKSFEFGMPRAEICCELGNLYKEQKDYERAIEWYKTATKVMKPENPLDSIVHDCYDFIPYAEISICYFNMGFIKEAVEYNNKAIELKPFSKVVLQNKKYFDTIIESVKQMF